MFNIALTRQPWFSLGIHIDHTPPVYIIIHLPGFLIWLGWFDVIGATKKELLWSLFHVNHLDNYEEWI